MLKQLQTQYKSDKDYPSFLLHQNTTKTKETTEPKKSRTVSYTSPLPWEDKINEEEVEVVKIKESNDDDDILDYFNDVFEQKPIFIKPNVAQRKHTVNNTNIVIRNSPIETTPIQCIIQKKKTKKRVVFIEE